jgi:hypothetical protein
VQLILAAILHTGNIEFLTEMGATDLCAVIVDTVRRIGVSPGLCRRISILAQHPSFDFFLISTYANTIAASHARF